MGSELTIQHPARRQGNSEGPVIWAIGGGKGGIGKSFISTNLSICLARLGRTATVLDLDLGSANLHTCLGLKAPQVSLSDFLNDIFMIGRLTCFDHQ